MKVLLPLAVFIGLGALLHYRGLLLEIYIIIPYSALGVICMCLSYVGGQFYRMPLKPEGKAVVIIGCDAGCGYHAARALDALGFTVFAGCLQPPADVTDPVLQSQVQITVNQSTTVTTDQSELLNVDQSEIEESINNQSAEDTVNPDLSANATDQLDATMQIPTNQSDSRIKFFKLDPTSDSSVKEAVRFVSTELGDTRLWAFIYTPSFHAQDLIELLPLSAYQAHFDINCLGLIRVTRSFLPTIRASQTRVINVLGCQARITQPGDTAFSMCQHATLAFTESLRMEMRPFKVKVVTVEAQYGVATLAELPDENFENGRVQKRQELQQAYSRFEKVAEGEDTVQTRKSMRCVDVIVQAVRSGRPRKRYLSSVRLRMEMWLLAIVPAHLGDWYKQKYWSSYKLAKSTDGDEPRSRQNSDTENSNQNLNSYGRKRANSVKGRRSNHKK